jgi:hypothetical protein
MIIPYDKIASNAHFGFILFLSSSARKTTMNAVKVFTISQMRFPSVPSFFRLRKEGWFGDG